MDDSAKKAGTKRQAPPHAWKPGQSGNPTGRPRIAEEVREMAAARTTKAILALERILDSEDDRAVVAAANALLDRACGKPTQEISAVVAAAVGPLDFSHLSPDELRTLIGIMGKVPGNELAAPAPGVDDGPPAEDDDPGETGEV